jgi:hypothetical protein
LFLPRFLLSCRPQFRRSACLRGPSPRISVLLGPVSVFFLVRFLNVCVCVCSCLLCVYVFLCFIQVKALVVAFLAEFLSFLFRIVFASVIGRSKE